MLVLYLEYHVLSMLILLDYYLCLTEQMNDDDDDDLLKNVLWHTVVDHVHVY